MGLGMKAILKGVEPEITVKNLFDYLEEENLPYDVINDYEALEMANSLGLYYPYQPQIMGPVKYNGKFDGDDITCFVTIGGDLVVYAIYGTIDEGFMPNDVVPGYDFSDIAVRVK